uniref:Uncharacterized protein n=1 Tax=Trichuris muris TaxID=70415 RepID=A0A5S6Q4S0_TRIMR
MDEKLYRNSDVIERYLDKLKDMQQELKSQINDSEVELATLDQQLQMLNERRIALMHDIEKKKEALRGLESSTSAAEVSFQKLIESSESLIAFMKKRNE